MGAIQGAINQALITAGAAAYGLKEQHDKALSASDAAKKEIADIDSKEAIMAEEAKGDIEKANQLVKESEQLGKEHQALQDIKNTPGAIRSAEDVKAFQQLAQSITEPAEKIMMSQKVLAANQYARVQQLAAYESKRQIAQKTIKRSRMWGGK